MNPKRLNKIYFILFLMTGTSLVVGLIIYALDQNINLFYTPTQIAHKEAPVERKIRIGGMVEKGSLNRREGMLLEFVVTDYKEKVSIQYSGILPDLFREGQGVVVLGRLQKNGIFKASQILAKHDENYMPREVKESLQKVAEKEARSKRIKYDP